MLTIVWNTVLELIKESEMTQTYKWLIKQKKNQFIISDVMMENKRRGRAGRSAPLAARNKEINQRSIVLLVLLYFIDSFYWHESESE